MKWAWRHKNSHMAQLTIATSNAQHYVKMLCTTTRKPPSTSKFYVDFKKKNSKIKNWNTPSVFRCVCVLSGSSLSWNTPVFSCFSSREHAKLHRLPFLSRSHVVPHRSKAQLLKWKGRSFLGVTKNWKVTLDGVPWFGAMLKICRVTL